jgi:hypothetical protein
MFDGQDPLTKVPRNSTGRVVPGSSPVPGHRLGAGGISANVEASMIRGFSTLDEGGTRVNNSPRKVKNEENLSDRREICCMINDI